MSFKLRSFQQIIGDGIRKFKAKTGITDFRPGSVAATILEVISSEDFQQYYQMLQIIRSYNIDTTEGDDLNQRAIEITGQGRLDATRSVGVITVGDSSFTKISSKIYAGLPGPVAGQNYLYVNDASSFPASGTVIVGRSTDNVETIAYSSITNLVNFYKINLTSILLNDHGTDETVILSQGGNRNIQAGTLVRVPQSDQSFEVFFSIDVDSILLDGEDTLQQIAVTAVEPGDDGNVAARSIISFDSPPFPGATVINPSAFTNARAEETDPEMRDRIKTFLQTLSRGTPKSIVSAAIGVVDTEQNKRVVSAKLIDTTNLDDIPVLYIDDGVGFEPSFNGIGNEILLLEATGGEQFLQLRQFPIVKAQIECLNSEPFNISAGDTLTINVEGSEETITFASTDFAVQQSATAEEIATAINDRLTIIEARTSRIGQRVVIRARRQENENIKVIGGTANSSTKLNFPTAESTTLLLYKISSGALKVLSKDGTTAVLQNDVPDNPINITTHYKFKYSVDGRVDVEVDLRPTGLGGNYSGSYAFNSDVTLAELVDAINDTAPGITASLTSNGTRITLTSNTERSSSSKVQIKVASSNDINDRLNFPLTLIVGKDSDYTLNRFNGQIELKEPLQAGDSVTAGSVNTRGFLKGTIVGPYNLESGGADSLTFELDNGAAQLITWLPGDFSDITSATPEEVVTVLNRDLAGATAFVNDDNTITIRTNYWESNDVFAGGAIIVTALSGNGNAMGFPFNTQSNSIGPHTPFLVSGNPEPYQFEEGDQLIVVLDNDPQNKTFAVTIDLDCEVNVGDGSAPYNTFGGFVSNSAQDIGVKFPNDQDLVGMRAIFKTGNNFEASKVITNGVDPDPDVGGSTPIEVNIIPNATASQVAAAIATTVGVNVDFLGSSLGANFTLTNEDDGTATDATAGTSGFGVSVLTQGVNPLAEITQVNCPPFASIADGQRFHINSANNAVLYYVYFDTTGGNLVDPAPPGRVGIRVNIAGAVSGTDVATTLAVTLNANPNFAASNITNTVTVTNEATGPTTDAVNINVGGTFSILVTQQGAGAKESTQFTAVADVNGSLSNKYFFIYSAANATKYYVWLHVNGAQTSKKFLRADTDVTSKFLNSTDLTAFTAKLRWTSGLNEDTEQMVSFYNPANGIIVLTTDAPFALLVDDEFEVRIEAQITSYDAGANQIVATGAWPNAIASGDDFILLPRTASNVATFMNNTTVTTFPVAGRAEAVDSGTRVQLESKTVGNAGIVNVTGGSANDELDFSTIPSVGKDGYQFYTGLLRRVQRIIDGLDNNLGEFSGVRAAGVQIEVAAPTIRNVAIILDVTLSGLSVGAVSNEIRSKVSNYINSLGIGDDVILSKIKEQVLKVTAVRDVKVQTPLDNIPIADNEVAKILVDDIVIA